MHLHIVLTILKRFYSHEQLITNQANKDTEELNDISVGDWVEATKQCVQNGYTRRNDDGSCVVKVDDHWQSSSWKGTTFTILFMVHDGM